MSRRFRAGPVHCHNASVTDVSTVVLVHGGFLGPWLWKDVQLILEARGIRSVAPDLPSVGDQMGDLNRDAATVRQALKAVGPAVLCGHSYAGLVITEAANDQEVEVTRLAYLAAAVPDDGQSVQSLATSLGLEDGDDGGEEVVVLPDGRIGLRPEAARTGLFHDCAPDRAEEAISLLRPTNPATGSQPVSQAAWRQIPATLIEAADDRLPRLVCSAFDSTPHDSVSIPTGHCPQWSPDLVADLLGELVLAR
jgi:pimeloyl-ACP methyl ester carboxylesterase